jgi:hypothetical protein
MLIKMVWPWLLLTGSLLAGLLVNGNSSEEGKLSKLPGISAKGVNSFGCLLNNEPWATQQVEAQVHVFDQSVCLSLRTGPDYETRLAFILPVDELKPGVYLLDDPASAYVHFLQTKADCLFTSDEFYQGVLTITTHDESQRTLSGMFEFFAYSQLCRTTLLCTHGRFDVSYRMY